MSEKFIIHNFVPAPKWAEDHDESEEFLTEINLLLPKGHYWLRSFGDTPGYYLVEYTEDLDD